MAGAAFGDSALAIFVTGAVFSDSILAVFVAGATFCHSVLAAFVAGAAFTVGALDLRHVFRSKKVLVFNAMEDITNDEYLARS